MAGNRHHGIRTIFIGSLCGGIGPGGLALNDAPKCAHNFAYRYDGLEVLLTIPGGRREFNKANCCWEFLGQTRHPTTSKALGRSMPRNIGTHPQG